MNRVFSFLAGALCGTLVGAVAALLLTPTSGEQLRTGATNRLEQAFEEARKAMDATQKEMDAQFEQMKQGEPLES